MSPSSALQRSIDDCMEKQFEDYDDKFSELRQLILHNRGSGSFDCLPDILVRSVLTFLSQASKLKCSQSLECIRIVGVQRAASVAKTDTKLRRNLARMFQGQHDLDQFVVGEADARLSPDEAKAKEVEGMQKQYKKQWPQLLQRFRQGSASKDPTHVLQLLLETVDYIMTPIEAVDLYTTTTEVVGDGFSAVQEKKEVLVVVGITGAGKSVTCNWLAGRHIEKVADEDEDGEEEGTKLQVDDAKFAVGHDSFNSKTFPPTVIEVEDFILIDFPGSCDTSGIEIRIGMDIAFRRMVSRVKPAHVLALIPIESFMVGRGTVAKQQLSKLQRLLPTQGASLGAGMKADAKSASVWKIGVTKCDKDFAMKPKTLFKEAVELVKDFDECLVPHIFNLNELMFSGKASSREDLIKTLFREASTPEQNTLTEFWQRVKRVFGGDGDSGGIISDCLNPSDTEAFGRIFMSAEFEQAFIERDLEEIKRCSSFASDPATPTSGEHPTWESFSERIDAQVGELRKYTNTIIQDSKQLIDHGALSLERRCDAIKRLCGYKQCRLKLCFVEAEAQIMMSNLKNAVVLNGELHKSAMDLKRQGFFRDTDLKAVLDKYEQSCGKLTDNARSLGFTDTAALLAAVSDWAGAAAIVGGSVVGGTAWCSTTLPAFMAASGALSGGALTGLLGGGLILAVGAAIFLACEMASQLRAKGDQYSERMKDKLIMAFSALMEASDAATKHKVALGAITATLHSLEVPLRD
eukprot:TRINITY_DN42123_c0_g1_i1.p1 TRINITY_DN42123_c0_g1~~TRINITY_DN42123_c0_g1_i1.p1  ORF type:complete len:747 (-),score=165.12 TRINITY_DN42123_c0_g1_i1:327-2567(-)